MRFHVTPSIWADDSQITHATSIGFFPRISPPAAAHVMNSMMMNLQIRRMFGRSDGGFAFGGQVM
jgi:hypothetical protein